MERYTKKALVLVLASVITVAGSLAADNYKNAIMSIKFQNSSSETVNMAVLTKTEYNSAITPKKKDANTYVIMLPEVANNIKKYPETSGNIESIDIKTIPYSDSSKGYTKITIKTNSNITLNAKSVVYIPKEELDETNPVRTQQKRIKRERYNSYNQKNNLDRTNNNTSKISEAEKQYNQSYETQKKTQEYETPQVREQENTVAPDDTQTNYDEKPANQTASKKNYSNSSSNDALLAIGGALIVIFVVAFLYMKSKRKMAEMIGDQSDLDFSEEKKEEKKTSNPLKKKISDIDKMYQKPIRMPIKTINEEYTNKSPDKNDETYQEENIVDLDELFQQTQQKKDDDTQNDDLESFLNDFNFDDEDSSNAESREAEQQYDQELYEKYLNNDNINFSEEDVEKINSLINSEVSEKAIDDLKKQNVASAPSKKRTKKEILEDFVTTISIKQNISFSKEDIDALNKLLCVELDNDFITDLRTNPERANSMRKEIEDRKKSASKKVNEILTLNVKDMLPDLSEALKKQGNKKIESEAKPDVVYYSEGYEYTTLSIKDELPDISTLYDKKANAYRPSDDVEYAMEGYDTPKLKIEGALPDLNDVKANPNKYEDKKEKPFVANEADLLKNLANISFKPFYDGTENYEVLNKPEDFENIDKEDIKEEFSQFDNFEFVEEEKFSNEITENDAIFDELYDNNYYDLDKASQNTSQDLSEPVADEDIIKAIEAEKKEPQNSISKDEIQVQPKVEKKINLATPLKKDDVFDLEGESYKVVTTQSFTENMGCLLAKNEKGYSILGFVGEKIFKIKYYEKLNSENMQSRISKKLEDGTTRYIVRIGLHKFIMNVKNDDMEYVMDLC